MKLLNKIFLLILTFFIISCGVIKENNSSIMKYSFNLEATLKQIDSVCNADALPSLDKWLRKNFDDFETGVNYTKLMYIKTLNNKAEVIYILLIDEEEPYPFQKRIVKL